MKRSLQRLWKYRAPRRFLLVSAIGALLLTAQAGFAVETITLEADADTTVRTDLDVRRNDNYGCGQVLQVGTSRGGGGIPSGGADAMRSLIYFDLTTLPQQGLLTASLEIPVWRLEGGTGSSVFKVDVHRLLAPWIEGNGSEQGPLPSSCINVDDAAGVAWVGASDGGDANNQTQPAFAADVEATAMIAQNSTPGGTVIQWNVTALVQAWLAGTQPNFGMLLRDGTSDGTFREIHLASQEARLYPAPPPPLAGPRLLLTFVPAFQCVGFEPPMDSGPVSVKKNRALPFKAQLVDAQNNPITDADIAAPPVIQILFTPLNGEPPVDVTAQALPTGLGTPGNQFVFTTDNKWQFNLKTIHYTASGQYQVSMVSGDSTAYVLQPTCQAEFVIK